MTNEALSIRILVLDDEADVRESAAELAKGLTLPADLHVAANVTEAASLLDEYYFDVVLIDLQAADGSLAGLELFRYLNQIRSTSRVAFMTHVDLDMNHTNIMNTIAISQAPHVDRFIDKRRSGNVVTDAAASKCAELQNASIEIDGLSFLAELVTSRKSRYHQVNAVALRSTAELKLEVERMFRRLFLNRVYGKRQTTVSVTISPIERLGLSAAVLVNVRVQLQLPGVPSTSSYDCVLKVGPRDEITEEAGRYLEFVQFGVRLDERVELLAHTEGDTVGAIVYSIAGGGRGVSVSLDDLLLSDTELATQVIDRLFSSTNWYDTRADSASIRRFFDDAYHTDLPSAFDVSRTQLEKAVVYAGASLRLNTSGELEISDLKSQKLRLPSRSFSGLGRVLRPHAWCLVHGDMHGGNVMAEILQGVDGNGGPGERTLGRVSLIDYRQAGPGPRCIDAAALECAVRSADAHAIKDVEPDPAKAAQAALRTYSNERSLLRYEWGNGRRAGDDRNDATSWQTASRAIVRGARKALSEPPVSGEEYLLTCLLFGLRQLRYPMSTVGRLRISAWVAALYEVYSALPREAQ